MAITLNGTTGISSPGGDTSTSLATTNLSYTGTLTGGTGVIAIGTNQIYKDASGNVGIGTSSPAQKLHLSAAGNLFAQFSDTTNSVTAYAGIYNSAQWIGTSTSHPITFNTANTERARIDTSGNLLLGTSTSNGLLLEMTSTTQQTCGITVVRSSPNIYTDIYGCGTGGTWQGGIRFFTSNNAAASERARIDSSGNLLVGTTSGTGYCRMNLSTDSGTNKWDVGPRLAVATNFYILQNQANGVYIASGANAWTAYSDERLKTDLKPIENAAQKVSTLRAVTGRFKTDDESVSRSFLIAQDVQAVLPEAVDASDPDKLGVAYTDTIPLLVAAIQELTTRLAKLEAK